MSAYMVHPEHVHVMIWAAVQYGGPGIAMHLATDEEPTPYNAVQDAGAYNVRVLRRGTETAVGQMLTNANAASVNTRYAEDAAYIYEYRPPKYACWEPVEILGIINAFEYQACEAGDWLTCEAKHFCDRLRRLAEAVLPHHNDAPWAIDDSAVPRALRECAN